MTQITSFFSGKTYEDNLGLEIFRVNPNLSLDQILEKIGVPDNDENPHFYTNGLLTGIFLPTENEKELTSKLDLLKGIY